MDHSDVWIVVGVASSIVALLDAVVVFPLPPSPALFDAVGRVAVVYGTGAVVIAVAAKVRDPDEPLTLTGVQTI